MTPEFHVGLDDIDSPRGGCTTHFASLLAERLSEWGVEWIDYPNLVRLNPNIPFRTRGNGAAVLRFRAKSEIAGRLISLIRQMIPNYIEQRYQNTNPGVVILHGPPPEPIKKLAETALWRVVPVETVMRIFEQYKKQIKFFGIGNNRGLVGATAAIGNQLIEDHTFEFIAYRSLSDTQKRRGVDSESVFVMNSVMGNRTFSNIDPVTDNILIAPHGPDPVLYGIRGERPEDVKEAASQIKSEQKVERWTIFRTNQGTGQHLRHRVRIAHLRPYMAAVVKGTVEKPCQIIEGGHAIFRLRDSTGIIDCAVYEPTGEFREIVMRLIPGDIVQIHAGVRPASRNHGRTLNVEGLEVLSLTEKRRQMNPICPKCGKRMKSAGEQKGFKCIRCGHRERKGKKVISSEHRALQVGVYLPPPRAQRHLTRPLSRWGKKNTSTLRAVIDSREFLGHERI